ncbi:uncharacterized protein HD556DRAFT_1302683 [Suillus plorans]|uniref:Uncharacterized protein n=1 Tax=Suillus plorans TaxID=116603 RepID=A0A9P7E4A1_9AGAM|nr:uncharacterized protein HD556DRAFT_1302683 [Suillus plorans]KAG1810368.1 hypothetical protein HD556DRAFT_1302683 [Suillus plorans]
MNNARGQSNIYAKVAAEYFRSKVHVNKHEALRTMGKHVIVLAATGASKTGWDTDRTSVQENIRSAVAETSCLLVKASGPLVKHELECYTRLAIWLTGERGRHLKGQMGASSLTGNVTGLSAGEILNSILLAYPCPVFLDATSTSALTAKPTPLYMQKHRKLTQQLVLPWTGLVRFRGS